MKLRKLRFTSQSGQASLVGTLVAASLGITAIMGTMSLFKASSQAQRTVQSRGDATDLGTSLRMIVDNPALCSKALWDSEKTPRIAFFDPDDPKLAARKLPFGIHFGDAPLVTLGSKPDPAITVTSVGLTEVDKGVRTSTTTTTTYLASLTLGLAWDGTLAYRGPNSLSQPLYVQTDNTTHQILNCGRTLASQPLPPTGQQPAPPALSYVFAHTNPMYRIIDYNGFETFFPANSAPVFYNTVSQDLLGEYDPTSGIFTPQNDGLYEISAGYNIVFQGPWGTCTNPIVFCNSVIRVGGSTVPAVSQTGVPDMLANCYCAASVSTVLSLKARQPVSPQAYLATSPGAKIHTYLEKAYLSIARLR